MNKLYKRLALVALFFLPLLAHAQEAAKKDKEEPKSSRAHRREAKKQWKEQRRNERLEKKKIKEYQKRTQTKKVRKRMKGDKKEAQRNNDHNGEPLLKRWFGK